MKVYSHRIGGHALLVVLPKTRAPTEPKELRPIALGSTASKIFCRMLLARAESVIRPAGPAQCTGKARQTCDYLFAISRTFELEREWKGGAAWYRLDITKAFDSLKRCTFLAKVQSALGRTEELRCWVRTLQGNTAIDLTRGIKQGAVESPAFFGKVIEWAYEEARVAGNTKAMPGLMVDGVAFMDDGVLWEGRVDRLKKKVEDLTTALHKWGLSLNNSKQTIRFPPCCDQVHDHKGNRGKGGRPPGGHEHTLQGGGYGHGSHAASFRDGQKQVLGQQACLRRESSIKDS